MKRGAECPLPPVFEQPEAWRHVLSQTFAACMGRRPRAELRIAFSHKLPAVHQHSRTRQHAEGRGDVTEGCQRKFFLSFQYFAFYADTYSGPTPVEPTRFLDIHIRVQSNHSSHSFHFNHSFHF